MLRQREIISLLNQGQSQNAICSLIHCSKRSVSEVSKAVRDTGKSYGELLALSDSELLTVLSPQAASQVEDPRKAELEQLMPEVMRLDYFGETNTNPCGICDTCRTIKKEQVKEAKEAIADLLKDKKSLPIEALNQIMMPSEVVDKALQQMLEEGILRQESGFITH